MSTEQTQPAPQGVAEVMDVMDAFEADNNGFYLAHEHMAEWFQKLRSAITAIVQERDALKATNRLLHSGQLDLVSRLAELEVNYHELLYAVAHKHPDETRHQTALRYIMRAEKAHGSDGAGAASSKEAP